MLDYQRSLIVQTAILRNKIDEIFFESINKGDLRQLSQESLACFLSVYPRENEVKAFVLKLANFGYRSFIDAHQAIQSGALKSDSQAKFMIALLRYET